ncbi:SPOR domain-containing protein [Chondrinema litorale]|uniref:SPOR domain-containing protein n=1 Tax=Chondrinema litorale TaxID=2994555 RepID=UPI0025432172|nr:SPOR domain-containing protein [Chondrinema litorale]UZR92555.1 SPOR domain-containing protein [Chondrinema litorale]
MQNNLIRFLLILLVLSACKSNQIASNTPFSDNINIYRVKPVIEDTTVNENQNTSLANKEEVKEKPAPNPELDINYDLDQSAVLLAQRNRRILEEQGIVGYTIQVYSGTSRGKAEDIRDELLVRFDEKTKRAYDRPNYKVKIGEFLNKMEAYELFLLLKDDYPQALIIPDMIKVDMDKYLLESEKKR